MYDIDNYMTIGNEAYLREPRTWTEVVTVNVITDIVNIGRWAHYHKSGIDRNLGYGCICFETDIDVEVDCTEDWDDEMGPCVSYDRNELIDGLRDMMRAIDPDADYETV